MRIKNSVFIFIQLILIFFISYGVIKLLSFSQVKKEYNSLEFIPDDVSFVGRIEAKKIGIEILKEFINSDEIGKLPSKKKDKKIIDMSFIDLDYPLYFFMQKVHASNVSIAVIKISNQDLFLKNVNSTNSNSFGFIHANKGFWVFNCPKKDSAKIKLAITTAKSKRWEKLRSSPHKIAFIETGFDIIGHVDIDQNLLKINARSNSIYLPFKPYKKLKTEGFNISLSNPVSFIQNLGENSPSLIGSTLTGIQAISLNHYGFRSPFFPNLTLLLQVDSSFNLKEKINKINSSQLEIDDNKLYVAGAKFHVSKPQSDCYLLSYKENPAYTIEKTSKLFESSGNLSTLIDFNDAPLLKMFFLSNSTFSNIFSLIQKTDKYNFTISKVDSSNQNELNFSIELKKPNSFYKEMLEMLI